MLQRQKRQKSAGFIVKTPFKSIAEHQKVRELPAEKVRKFTDETRFRPFQEHRRTHRSGASQTLSWSVIQQNQQAVGTPANLPPMEISERSRPPKRSDHSRSPVTSKSPRRNTEPLVGANLVGSPAQSLISPSMAAQMRSPPRELTRTTRTLLTTPQNIPITDVTSGREAILHGRNPSVKESSLNQEVVTLTQRQLTSEFEVAEMSNYQVEAEIRQRNLEHELSQEIHMFNQARTLIGEMRENFSVEDQGCIGRMRCWKPKEMSMLWGS